MVIEEGWNSGSAVRCIEVDMSAVHDGQPVVEVEVNVSVVHDGHSAVRVCWIEVDMSTVHPGHTGFDFIVHCEDVQGMNVGEEVAVTEGTLDVVADVLIALDAMSPKSKSLGD